MIWIRNLRSRFGGLFVLSRSAAATLDWLLLLEQVGDFFVLNLFVVIHGVRLHHIELAVRSFDDRELFVMHCNSIHCVRTAVFNRLVRENSVSDQACQTDLQLSRGWLKLMEFDEIQS